MALHRGHSDASDEPLKEAYHGVAVLRGGESVEVLDKPEEAYRSTAVLRGVESMKSSFEALKLFSVQVVFEQEAHSKRGYGHGTPSNSAPVQVVFSIAVRFEEAPFHIFDIYIQRLPFCRVNAAAASLYHHCNAVHCACCQGLCCALYLPHRL